jgi:hypothetical protein
MPEIRSLARGGAVAAAALMLQGWAASCGLAGQVQGTLAVSVEVVETCHAATDSAGLAAQGCDGPAAPVAVLREPAPAAAAPSEPAPLMRVSEPGGYVTIVY